MNHATLARKRTLTLLFRSFLMTKDGRAGEIRTPRSKFWSACFRDANGRQRRKSTKTSDRKKAIKVAEQCEQVGERKMPTRAVRETLAELYREIYKAFTIISRQGRSANLRDHFADLLPKLTPEERRAIYQQIERWADLSDTCVFCS